MFRLSVVSLLMVFNARMYLSHFAAGNTFRSGKEISSPVIAGSLDQLPERF